MGTSPPGALDRARLRKKAEREAKVKRDDYFREELETAWLRGNAAGERRAGASSYGSPKANAEVLQEAADYAERVMGGSTRPEVER